MSTINGVSSSGNSGDPWAAMKAQRSQMQAKMFAKVDADSSGGVDQAELKTMLSDISQKTGLSIGGNAADTFTKMDANADGKLSSEELEQGMQSLMPPPPSTMDFAQTRGTGGSGQDDLFAKIDTNGDGALDQTEIQTLTDKIKSDTGKDATDMFAKLDTDSDGKLTKTEFEAARPQGGPPPPGGPGGAGGPSGPSGAGGAGGSGSASSSTDFDPLDTNQDGTVSALERMAGEIKEAIAAALIEPADAAQTSKTAGSAARFDVAQLAKMVYAQIAAGFSEQSSRTVNATA